MRRIFAIAFLVLIASLGRADAVTQISIGISVTETSVSGGGAPATHDLLLVGGGYILLVGGGKIQCVGSC